MDPEKKIRDVVALSLDVDPDRVSVALVGVAQEGFNKVYMDIKLDGVDLTEEQQDQILTKTGGKITFK